MVGVQRRADCRTDASATVLGRAAHQLLATLAGSLLAAAVASPAAMGACTVGTGVGTCTEAALVNCLPPSVSFDGVVVFNCGGAATITVTSAKLINANTTIDGGGLITISGGLTTSVFTVSAADLTLQDLTIANARSNGGLTQGGAITNGGTVTVTGCTFSNNASNGTLFGRGGAILNQTNASLFIDNSTFINNTASAVAPANGSAFAEGGALHLTGGNGATVITNSTFSGNAVSETGPGAGNGDGGAINNATASKLTITNSTFVGNTASGDTARGGAIIQNGLGGQTTTITNCTFVATTALLDGSSFYNSGGTFELTNTIVAVAGMVSAGTNCAVTGTGTFSDSGHNMEDGASCGFTGAGCANMAGTSFCNTNPQLDPAGLANNGGSTQTDALCSAIGTPTGCLAVSPAINAGDQTVCATTTGTAPVNNVDQRGFGRPGAGHSNCCIGAFEADGVAPPTVTPTASDTSTPTLTAAATETSTETATATATATASHTGTATGTITDTPTGTHTPTVTATRTVTNTATTTSTSTATGTATQTPTVTSTRTVTNTRTATPTFTPAPDGASCDTPSDCVSGNCVDDTCCADASCPPGQACNNPGHTGECSSDPLHPAPTLSGDGMIAAFVLLLALGILALRRRARGE